MGRKKKSVLSKKSTKLTKRVTENSQPSCKAEVESRPSVSGLCEVDRRKGPLASENVVAADGHSPVTLDLTVTYDYACGEENVDQSKSMEELSGIFSFKVSRIVMLNSNYIHATKIRLKFYQTRD